MFKILGIDLAGSEERHTGVCIMDENLNAKTFLIKTNEEIINLILNENPRLVAIDAPLSIPRGRSSLEERSNIHLRECDKELLRLRIKFFPVTLGPMRMLTKRGIMLKNLIEGLGVEVIEVFPGATQDILGLPRKHKGIDKLREHLVELGIKGLNKQLSADELDAVTCAYTGYLYLKGECIELGNKEEGTIVVPKIFIKRKNS